MVISRTLLVGLRVLQILFAIILLGITSYFCHLYREWSTIDTPVEVSLPLATSVFAIIFAFVSLFAFVPIIVEAVLDFIIFVLYIASAGVLQYNFHVRNSRNPLWHVINALRATAGEEYHGDRIGGLVKMLAAGVILQILLFFVTMVLAALVARRERIATGGRVRHAV